MAFDSLGWNGAHSALLRPNIPASCGDSTTGRLIQHQGVRKCSSKMHALTPDVSIVALPCPRFSVAPPPWNRRLVTVPPRRLRLNRSQRQLPQIGWKEPTSSCSPPHGRRNFRLYVWPSLRQWFAHVQHILRCPSGRQPAQRQTWSMASCMQDVAGTDCEIPGS